VGILQPGASFGTLGCHRPDDSRDVRNVALQSRINGAAGYAVPFLCLAFVTWAVASRRFSDELRRVTMVVTILLTCGVWTLLRTSGIDGDHVADFA
jgi:hypothetical protein